MKDQATPTLLPAPGIDLDTYKMKMLEYSCAQSPQTVELVPHYMDDEATLTILPLPGIDQWTLLATR